MSRQMCEVMAGNRALRPDDASNIPCSPRLGPGATLTFSYRRPPIWLPIDRIALFALARIMRTVAHEV